MLRRIPSLALLVGLTLLAGCSAAQAPETAAEQIRFGIEMAERGLWSEAHFRFQRAAELGVSDATLLNNLAVASEALGQFDRADDLYRRAIAARPGDDDLRKNYERFSAFYSEHEKRIAETESTEAAENTEEAAAEESTAPSESNDEDDPGTDETVRTEVRDD